MSYVIIIIMILMSLMVHDHDVPNSRMLSYYPCASLQLSKMPGVPYKCTDRRTVPCVCVILWHKLGSINRTQSITNLWPSHGQSPKPDIEENQTTIRYPSSQPLKQPVARPSGPSDRWNIGSVFWHLDPGVYGVYYIESIGIGINLALLFGLIGLTV